MKKYQTQHAIALAKETNHHVQAAARQLETLQKLERRGNSKIGDTKIDLQRIDENYIGKNDKDAKDDNIRENTGEDTNFNKYESDVKGMPLVAKITYRKVIALTSML